MHRKLYVAAYDVRHPARLPQALRVVRGHASGGQKSAYECWLSSAEWRALHAEMAEVLNPARDQFALIPLEPRRPLVALGVARTPADPDFFYFG
jgi:CRISPR-associated protein Cas2